MRKSLRESTGLPNSRHRLAGVFSTSALPLLLAAVIDVAPRNVGAYIPATRAFDAPGCSAGDLGNDVDLARVNPEWKAIILDPNHPLPNNPPTILEGFILSPPLPPVCLDVLGQLTTCEQSKDQAPAEVAEEDIPWNHYTHDFTFKVVPDPAYEYLLSSWVRFPGVTIPNLPPIFCGGLGGTPSGTNCVVPPETCPDHTTGTTCHHSDMEVEWENGSLMDEGEGFQRIWGVVPEFVWPAVNDRVWVEGRWIFDCGHPSVPLVAQVQTFVKFSTEIHPPRALVTFRLNHPALDSFPRPRTSAPNFPYPQSYLPVTGVPVDPATLPPGVPNTGPTNVPVTEADIFVSGNGGGANDLCSLVPESCPGHTAPTIPVNDRNYVFDIYPPGTDFHTQDPQGAADANGNRPFLVRRPVPDASLQWRIVDHSSELPAHACGGTDTTVCVTVEPRLCPIDASTAPPDQTETACPSVPAAQPTRLRVILPFNGTNANFLAKSILLGWDDVPAPLVNPAVRTFQVRLHKLTVVHNGESFLHDGDWRVFVNVGGQWRYISPLFDRDSSGRNVCHGDALTENGDGDCFQFDQTPWTVSIVDGKPIHVAVGGWESDPVDSRFCRNHPGGCNRNFGSLLDLAAENNDRIGTYEFDLTAERGYAAPPSFPTVRLDDGEQYEVEFRVQEIPAPTPPTSAPLQVGDPHYNQYVSSATPLTLSSTSTDARGFQYRFHRQGAPLPVYASPLSFPVHWRQADFAPGSHSVSLHLAGVDGPYDVQFSAQTFGNLLEPRHPATVTLDNTPPVISIVQPQATAYVHSAALTLSYSVSDAGSGVRRFTPTMDGSTTLGGHGLQSGQVINVLTELTLGTHTFNITAVDNVDNTGTSNVIFTVIVTPESIKDDVHQFLSSGAIHNHGIANSLLAKLNAAANARSRGQCSTAANEYRAFIHELEAQRGIHVDAAAAAIMIADAEYLIAHCP